MKLNKKSIIIAAAVVVVAAAAAVFFLWPHGGEDPQFTLPTPTASPEATPSPTPEQGSDVNRGNVLAVLAALQRTEVYEREMRFTTYWDGGESAVKITVKTDGERYRIVREDGSEVRTVVVHGGDYWLWYGDGQDLYRDTLGENRARELDKLMQLLTLEDVGDAPGFAVLDAAFVDYDGARCIYMEYSHGEELESVSRVWVSVDYGLVIAEETLVRGKLAFRMGTNMDTLAITTPPESEFEIPLT